MNDTTVNPYDFSDLSDLPEEQQTRLSASKGAEPEWVEQVVGVISGAPQALSLAQVIAVCTRMSIELPAETTVRNWLVNKVAPADRISRPTRQTYWAFGKAEVAADTAPAADGPSEEEDLLADL